MATRTRWRLVAWVAAALAAPGVSPGSAEAPRPAFESHWQDGKAELAGYHYHVTRYGQPRLGRAVLITVTEPFSESKRVKVDDPAANPRDTFEALKVNVVRDFQTGIYDYNTMTSVFVRSRDMSLAKTSFTSAEWCGNVYEEILFGVGGVRQSLRSYFEGESGEHTLAARPGGVSEDQLFILVRSLRDDYLKPGEKRRLSLLPGAIARRLAHRPLEWIGATIDRASRPERVRVPAGTFLADIYRVTTDEGRTGTFWVESAYPHRIVRWAWTGAGRREWSRGEAAESAEMAGSARLAYWRLHGNGEESYLKALGLPPQP